MGLGVIPEPWGSRGELGIGEEKSNLWKKKVGEAIVSLLDRSLLQTRLSVCILARTWAWAIISGHIQLTHSARTHILYPIRGLPLLKIVWHASVSLLAAHLR